MCYAVFFLISSAHAWNPTDISSLINILFFCVCEEYVTCRDQHTQYSMLYPTEKTI